MLYSFQSFPSKINVVVLVLEQPDDEHMPFPVERKILGEL